MDGFKILWVNPLPNLRQRCVHRDTVNFRLCVRTDQKVDHSDFIVRLWTNMCHKGSSEGEWHAVSMTYLNVAIKCENGTIDYLFGVDLLMTCVGLFGFNYRVVCKKLHSSERSDANGNIEVKQASVHTSLTEWIQYPMQAQITSNIWLGNHAAAVEAHEDGFDCLVNTADNAPVYVLQLNRPIILRKFPIALGVNNVISDKKIHTAVRYLWEASVRCKKILVYSKYGCARAPSVLIAYIYAKNPDLTFPEAVKFVDVRSPIYYHKGLKATLERLYPRS